MAGSSLFSHWPHFGPRALRLSCSHKRGIVNDYVPDTSTYCFSPRRARWSLRGWLVDDIGAGTARSRWRKRRALSLAPQSAEIDSSPFFGGIDTASLPKAWLLQRFPNGLLLATPAPAGRSPADLRARQSRAVAGTDPAGPPAPVEKPRGGRIVEIRADRPHSFAADEAHFAKNFLRLRRTYFACKPRGTNTRPPQNFIRHPIADAGETVLPQQRRLDGHAPMALEKSFHRAASKLI